MGKLLWGVFNSSLRDDIILTKALLYWAVFFFFATDLFRNFCCTRTGHLRLREKLLNFSVGACLTFHNHDIKDSVYGLTPKIHEAISERQMLHIIMMVRKFVATSLEALQTRKYNLIAPSPWKVLWNCTEPFIKKIAKNSTYTCL